MVEHSFFLPKSAPIGSRFEWLSSIYHSNPLIEPLNANKKKVKRGVICVFTLSPAALQDTKKLAFNVTSPQRPFPAKKGIVMRIFGRNVRSL
jgi:hypothetical protein